MFTIFLNLQFCRLYVMITDEENLIYQTWNQSKISQTRYLSLHYFLLKNDIENLVLVKQISKYLEIIHNDFLRVTLSTTMYLL